MKTPSRIAPLPPKNGITPSSVYTPAGEWPSLLAFLQWRFPHLPADVLRMRLARGDMVDAAGEKLSPESPYRPHSWIWYYRDVTPEVPVPFDMPVLYEDEAIVVVDKPHFLATIPSGRYLQETALWRVRQHCGNDDISPLHRLDRETAGILAFCKQPALRGIYQKLFQQKQVRKRYECIAPFIDPVPSHRHTHIARGARFFVQEEVDGLAPNSLTAFEQLSDWWEGSKHWAHYALWPTTGTKHQLRVHMAALGAPIRHDRYYPTWWPERAADDFEAPLQLLACELAFTDPLTGQVHCFTSQQRLACLPL